MSSYIHHEILLFLQSVITGAVLLLCYDVLLVLRKIIPHSGAVRAAEDICFWAAGGILAFTRVYRFNQGILRFFLLIGVVFGFFLIKWLLFPVRRCKLYRYNCACFIKNIKKTGKGRVKKGKQIGQVEKKKKEKQNRV